MQQSDHWLEMQGRLTEPMRYDAASDQYAPVAWDDASALIGRHLRAPGLPDAVFFASLVGGCERVGGAAVVLGYPVRTASMLLGLFALLP